MRRASAPGASGGGEDSNLDPSIAAALPLSMGDGLRSDVLFVATAEEALACGDLPEHMLVLLPEDAREPSVPACPDVTFLHTQETAERVALRAGEVLARHSEWDDAMVKMMVDGGDPKEFLELMRMGLPGPVSLVTEDQRVIALSHDFPTSAPLWQFAREHGTIPVDMMTPEELRDCVIVPENRDRMVGLRISLDPDHFELDVALQVGGEMFGRVTMLLGLEGPTVGEASLLKHACARMEGFLSRRSGSSGDVASHYMLATALLNGDDVPRSALRGFAKSYGWHDDEWLALVLIQSTVGVQTEEYLSFNAARLRLQFPNAAIVMLADSLAMLVGLGDNPVPLPSFAKALGLLLETMRARAAVSSAFRGLGEAPSHLAQCRLVLDLSDPEASPSLQWWDDVAGNVLMQKVASVMPPETLCGTLAWRVLYELGPMHVETLYHYLLCGRVASDAARLCYVHPNTVRYRIEKLQEAMGIDLGTLSEREMLHLILSCKLLLMRDES